MGAKKQTWIWVFGGLWIASILCMFLASGLCPQGDTKPCRQDCQRTVGLSTNEVYDECVKDESRLHTINRVVLFLAWFGFSLCSGVLVCLYFCECAWIRQWMEKRNWIDPVPVGIV